MGSAAVAGADVVIITDDNPRSEDPATIRKAIEDGAKEFVVSHPSRRSVEICNVGDRGQAIALAVNKSQAGDAIIVAGKGHEQGQLVGGEMRDFDDRIELRRALAADTGAQES